MALASFVSVNFFFRPDTQSYIEKLKREEQERAKGQTEDKRSFLAKYVSMENIRGQIFHWNQLTHKYIYVQKDMYR